MTDSVVVSSHIRHFPQWSVPVASVYKEQFGEAFVQVAATAVERESERRLPFEEVEVLRDVGFTKASLPEEYGGGGADVVETFELLAHLAQHDSNLAQLFRSHFSHVERQVLAPRSSARDRALSRIAGGEIIGNAAHERSGATVGSYVTKLSSAEGGYRLDGIKHYSTGTIFADWVSVAASDQDGDTVGVAVSTKEPGVARNDDWNGFGQRLTGSGTTVFDDVPVHQDDIFRRDRDAPSHGSAFVQLVLLAALSGVGRAVLSDATEFVLGRSRVYSHGSGRTAQEDPIVQETLGELSARAYAAHASLNEAVRSVQRSHDLQQAGAGLEERQEAAALAEQATAHAQLVVIPQVLGAATELFDVGGASALDSARGLDRHWRNARTIASHNPHRYKARLIGETLLNGTELVNGWATGEAKAEGEQ